MPAPRKCTCLGGVGSTLCVPGAAAGAHGKVERFREAVDLDADGVGRNMVCGGEVACRHGRPTHPQPHEPLQDGTVTGPKHGRRNRQKPRVNERRPSQPVVFSPSVARVCRPEPQRAPGFVSNPDGVQPPSSGPPENPGFNLTIVGQGGSQEHGGVFSPNPGLKGNVHSAPEILKDLRTPFTNCFKKPGADCEKDQVARMSVETLCHRAQAPSTHTVRSSSDCMGVWRARVEDRLAWVIVFLRPARVPASHRWATPRGGRWVPVA